MLSRVSAKPVDSSTIWPLGSSSPGLMAFLYLISQLEIPIFSAILSNELSRPKQVWVTPKPLKAPEGGLSV